MAEATQTPEQVKASMVADITGLMLLRKQDANGIPTGQPTNLPAWGVIFGDLKSRGMTDQNIKTGVSAVIQDFAVSHTARSILMTKVDLDNLTPEQKVSLDDLEQKELAAFGRLNDIVGAALENPQVRQKLQDAMLKNPANANPQAQDGIKGLFGAYAEAQGQSSAPASPLPPATPPVEPPHPEPTASRTPASPSPRVQKVSAPSPQLPVDRPVKAKPGPGAREALNRELTGENERYSPQEVATGLFGAGALGTTLWLINKYRNWGERQRFNEEVAARMHGRGWVDSGRNTSHTQTTSSPPSPAETARITPSGTPMPQNQWSAAPGQPHPTSSISAAGRNRADRLRGNNPGDAGAAAGGTGSAAASPNSPTSAPKPATGAPTGAAGTGTTGTGAASTGTAAATNVAAGEASWFSRFSRFLGRASTPIALGTTAYFASQDYNRGDYRGVTGKLGAGAGTLGGAATGAAIGTMIFPGVGTFFGGVIGGIGGYFAGEKAGDMAYDYFAEPDAAPTPGAAGKAKPEPAIDEPGRPNGLKHMKEDTITWGAVLGSTALGLARKSGWGRLTLLTLGATGAGATVGNYLGFEKDQKAAAERAANPTAPQSGNTPGATAPKADTAKGKDAKGDGKGTEQDSDEEGLGSADDETDNWLKKIIQAIMKLLSMMGLSGAAKWVGDLFGIGDDTAATAKGSVAAKTAVKNSPEEMRQLVDLAVRQENGTISSNMLNVLVAHQAEASAVGIDSAMMLGLQGNTDGARDKFANAMAQLVAQHPNIGRELDKAGLDNLRQQNDVRLAALRQQQGDGASGHRAPEPGSAEDIKGLLDKQFARNPGKADWAGDMLKNAPELAASMGMTSAMVEAARADKPGARMELATQIAGFLDRDPAFKQEFLNSSDIVALRQGRETMVVQGKPDGAKFDSSKSAQGKSQPDASADPVPPVSPPREVARLSADFPPTLLEMQILHQEVARTGSTGLRERLNDLVAGHGFRAFQKGAEDPFFDYVKFRDRGDQTGMSRSLLAITEQFPDFRRELYRDVMPGVLSSDHLQHARALDALQRPGQEGKLQKFADMVAYRAGTFDQAAAGGKGQDGALHRALHETIKRDQDGQPGIRENMPRLLAMAVAADPALEKTLFQLGEQSMPARPVVAQISTALPTTGITPLDGKPQGQQSGYARQIPLEHGRLVTASANGGQQTPGTWDKIKGYWHDIIRPPAGSEQPLNDLLGIPRKRYNTMRPQHGSPSVGGHVINPAGMTATQGTPTQGQPHIFTFTVP